MNIHINDLNLFDNLLQASVAKSNFGSILYNTNDQFSDNDIHYFYTTSDNEMNSFLKSHHHIQYKNANIDYVFVNIHTLIKNIINGDSTVLFEIIHSGNLINTPLEFLYNMRNYFNNYSIIRSYLGFAKRDVEHYVKNKTHREQIKTLGHIYRGYYFAKSLIENDFKLINLDFLKLFTTLKKIDESDYKTKKIFLSDAKNLITSLREELNYKYDRKILDIPKYMEIENQKKLDEHLRILINSDDYIYKKNKLKNFDMEIFYKAFENDINY